jgi:hypothetical protein
MEITKPIKYLCFGTFFSTVEITTRTRETSRTSVFSREIFRISLVVELGLIRGLFVPIPWVTDHKYLTIIRRRRGEYR